MLAWVSALTHGGAHSTHDVSFEPLHFYRISFLGQNDETCMTEKLF